MADDDKAAEEDADAEVVGKVADLVEAILLDDADKTRNAISDLAKAIAQAAFLGAAAGLAPSGLGLAGAAAAGAVASAVTTKLQQWLAENDATRRLTTAYKGTRSTRGQEVLAREVQYSVQAIIAPLRAAIESLPRKLSQIEVHQRELVALLDETTQPMRTADPLIGLLRTPHLDLSPNQSERSFAQLLDARYGVVPFDTEIRRNDLAALVEFCDAAPGRCEVLTVVGHGGAGKTRLLMHLCELLWARTGEFWHAGFLPVELHEQALDALASQGHPALVVIDYADTRLGLRDWLHRLSTGETARSKVRVVLAARNDGEWWSTLPQGDAALDHLLRRPVLNIAPVLRPCERTQVFVNAQAAYAAALGKAERCEEVPSLDSNQFSRPLMIHMAALVGLVDAHTPPSPTGSLAWRLIQRETKFWSQPAATLPWPTMRLMAGATLLGDVAPTELDRLAEAASHPVKEELYRRLIHLYPGELGLRGVEPDVLGEELVYAVLKEKLTPIGFIASVLSIASEKQLAHAFAVLGRITASHPLEGRLWFAEAVRISPTRYARAAFSAVMSAAQHGVDDGLANVLAEVLDSERDPRVASDLALTLPHSSLALRSLGVWVRQTLYDGAQTTADRAQCALELGIARALVGDAPGALTATEESASLYRALARESSTFNPQLMRALNNLANARGHMRDYPGAEEVAREVVAYRRFAADTPPRELANSLMNLAQLLSSSGKTSAAHDAAVEAVSILRAAEHWTQQGRADLSRALMVLQHALSANDAVAGLGCLREAVAIRRVLAFESPDAYRSLLAHALTNLGDALMSATFTSEASPVMAEATHLLRELAATRGEYRLLFARQLAAYGALLFTLEELAAARHLVLEAIELLERMPLSHSPLWEIYVGCVRLLATHAR
jgi:hypothetical protein